MLSKKVLLSTLAILVVAGGAYFYSSGASLQGKFKTSNPVKTTVVSDTTKVVTASPLLTLTNKSGSADNRNIQVSEIDYDTAYDPTDEMTTDPKAFSLATVSMKFGSGVTPCTDTVWEYILTDGGSYANYDDKIFDKLTMHFRSTSDNWWVQKVDNYPNKLSHFLLNEVSTLTGSDYYYYVDGTVKEGIDSSAYDENLTLYLRSACVVKGGTKYLWEKADDYGQNSYFSITSDGTYGLKIGTLKITE